MGAKGCFGHTVPELAKPRGGVLVTCEVKGDEGTSHEGVSPEEEIREPDVPLHHKRFLKLRIHSYSRRVKI